MIGTDGKEYTCDEVDRMPYERQEELFPNPKWTRDQSLRVVQTDAKKFYDSMYGAGLCAGEKVTRDDVKCVLTQTFSGYNLGSSNGSDNERMIDNLAEFIIRAMFWGSWDAAK